uniref:GOLD domain-containing protein n=1 Tax=Araucaria cunninghamii TaxID=56994 RepID=A0A0D6QVY3_ARACU
MFWKTFLQLLFLSSAALIAVNGLRFEVPSRGGSKCLSEEIQSNVVVLANYSVVKDDHAKQPHAISAQVSSPYGDSLHHSENVWSGQFGFTSKESGTYLACFWIANPENEATSSVDLDWKVGLAAKDWESIARKDKIEGVELELTKLEGAVEAIHQNLLYLKNREAEMREVSEVTNTRVAWFSIMSLTVCLLAAAWQLWHLKGFFEKKKLI